ncbi:MAG: restriction endonuclease subunit S [Bacteroidales bacterium]|nr:restriction endonuclease subunit S [Bacteroidales bacterium]
METGEKKNIPIRRFPEFLNDGEWEVKRLGEVAEFYKGKGISKTEASDKGKTPCVRYGELYTHYKEIIRETKSFTDVPAEELFLSKANDVVIPSSGETKEDISTASCIMNDNIALGGDINVIRSSNDGVFLSYYLNNAKKDDIAKIAQGVSIIHLYNEQLKNLQICIPSIEEQHKIAACLSVADEMIASTNGKLEQLKAYKKGLMQKLFPAKGKKLPELRLKEFEKDGEWEEKKLGEAVDVFQGYGFPERMQGKTQGKYPFIKVSDISTTVNNGRKYIDVANNYVDEEELSILGVTPFPIGTIIFAKIGEAIRLNRRVILSKPSLIDNNVGGVKAKDGLSNDDFVFYIMSMIDLVKYAGGVVPAVKKTAIENIEVLMPPTLYEQQRIADCFDLIDEMINQYTNKVTVLELYKKGLMQQMFPTSK